MTASPFPEKKRMHTSKIERWQRLDRLMLLVPIALPLVFLLYNLPRLGEVLFTPDASAFDVAVTVAVYCALCGVLSIPTMSLCRAVSRSAKKATLKSATFRVTEEFDYYRGELSSLSPAAISLLADLAVEPEKDIAACLLRYTMLGALSPDGELLEYDWSRLRESDPLLLDGVARGGLTHADVREWQNTATEEDFKG